MDNILIYKLVGNPTNANLVETIMLVKVKKTIF